MLSRIARKIARVLGVAKDPKMASFKRDYNLFHKLNAHGRFALNEADFFPCLADQTNETNFDAHYIYHPAWAARIVKQINPQVHIDISSTLHFCSILSAFIQTEFYDFRPANITLDNLTSMHADLTQLHFEKDSIESISCMHTLEHIGLGRYGDPIDPNGDLKAIDQLKRVCAPNGSLLVVVPVGVKKLMFNAHRIYDAAEFNNYFDGFTLQNFSLITDASEHLENASFEVAAKQQYGCGCYWYKKNPA